MTITSSKYNPYLAAMQQGSKRAAGQVMQTDQLGNARWVNPVELARNTSRLGHDMDMYLQQCKRCGVTMEQMIDSCEEISCHPKVTSVSSDTGIQGKKAEFIIVDDPWCDHRPRRNQLLLLT